MEENPGLERNPVEANLERNSAKVNLERDTVEVNLESGKSVFPDPRFTLASVASSLFFSIFHCIHKSLHRGRVAMLSFSMIHSGMAHLL